MVAFHREHVARNAIVAVVGAITVDEARRQVLARLGGWTRPSPPPPAVGPAIASGQTRSETVPRTCPRPRSCCGRQAIRQIDPDYFSLAVASYVLGGGSASRLYARVRDEGGLAYSVYSYVSPARYGGDVRGVGADAGRRGAEGQ